MGEQTLRRALRGTRQPPEPALLPAAGRPVAVAIAVACGLVIAAQGVWIRHGMETGWLDTTVSANLQASLGPHHLLLDVLVWPGEPAPAVAITAALVLACAWRRRYRQAVLVAVSVPLAEALTELVLKPLIGGTSWGNPYPSGHVTYVAALVTVLIVLLAGTGTRARPLLCAVLGFTALLVTAADAAGVIGAGMHHFSDTVGGAAVGIGTVLVTALILDQLSRTRSQRPE
jgi:membrane-associated phospholipid phosphatase